MPEPQRVPYKLGGVAFIVSGVLFFVRDLLDVAAGPPPAKGAEILAWVEASKIALSFNNEVLFFAAIALVPAVLALYQSLADVDRPLAATGCGIIAVAIPVLAMMLIVHGRLVYPVYGIHVDTPAVAEFVVALFFGGLHAVRLLLSFATIVLSLAMRRSAYGKTVVALGLTTGVLDVASSYPYAIGVALTLVCQVFFAAWFVAVGVKLYGMGGGSTESARRP
jgi:hypothetical protein